MTGLYKITLSDEGHYYIGQAVDYDKRIGQHLSNLKHQRHSNPHMQNIYNKYGIFKHELIIDCDISELNCFEQIWLDAHVGKEGCCNISLFAGSPMRGRKGPPRTEEHKNKLSTLKKGISRSEETKRKISETLKRKAQNESK